MGLDEWADEGKGVRRTTTHARTELEALQEGAGVEDADVVVLVAPLLVRVEHLCVMEMFESISQEGKEGGWDEANGHAEEENTHTQTHTSHARHAPGGTGRRS